MVEEEAPPLDLTGDKVRLRTPNEDKNTYLPREDEEPCSTRHRARHTAPHNSGSDLGSASDVQTFIGSSRSLQNTVTPEQVELTVPFNPGLE